MVLIFKKAGLSDKAAGTSSIRSKIDKFRSGLADPFLCDLKMKLTELDPVMD